MLSSSYEQRELAKWKALAEDYQAKAYFAIGENNHERAKVENIRADYCRYYVEKYTKLVAQSEAMTAASA